MMKSGEFSAHGRHQEQPQFYLPREDHEMGNYNNSEFQGMPRGQSNYGEAANYGRNYAAGVNYSAGSGPNYGGAGGPTYGNPNFVPPQRQFQSSQASFKGEPRNNDYYKNQYPATFQNLDAPNGSSQKNFSTSQFAEKPGSQTHSTNPGNNVFTLQRNSQESNSKSPSMDHRDGMYQLAVGQRQNFNDIH